MVGGGVWASLVVLVIRTRGPFWRSRPSAALTLATLLMVCTTVALPYTPLGQVFGFAPLPGRFLLLMALIVLAYVGCAELLKQVFYRRHHLCGGRHG